MCQIAEHSLGKRTRVFPLARTYSSYHCRLLSQEDQAPPDLRQEGRSVHKPEPTQGSTALPSPAQGRQYTHTHTPPARPGSGDPHAIPTPSKHSSLPDSCPSCRRIDPGHPPSMEQKPELHNTTGEGKHSFVVIEDAALQLVV